MQSKNQKYFIFNSDCRYELLTSEILEEQGVGVPTKNVEGLSSALGDKADKSLESKVQMLESIISELVSANEVNNDRVSVSPNLDVSNTTSTTKSISSDSVVIMGGKVESDSVSAPAVLTINTNSATISNLTINNAKLIIGER